MRVFMFVGVFMRVRVRVFRQTGEGCSLQKQADQQSDPQAERLAC